MKTKIVTVLLFLVAFVVVARVIAPFPGWARVEAQSPDIVIVVAREPVSLPRGEYVENAPKSDYRVTVISVLKGTNAVGNIRLETDQELRKGEGYLAFGNCDGGVFTAYEDYLVVPLGTVFRQDMIAGKSLDDQIQVLFGLGVQNFNQKIQKYQKEKQRLELGIKK